MSVQTLHQGNRSKPLEHPSNARVREAFDNWSWTGAVESIYDWWIPGFKHSRHWKKVPWYPGETTMKDQRYWHRRGVRYAFYESNRELGDGLPIRWPLWYVGARGLWNLHQSAGRIMTEACNKLYGSAAADMLAFCRLIEKAMAGTDRTASVWNLPDPEDVYTPEIEEEATRLLETAVVVTTDDAILARIDAERGMWLGSRQVILERRATKLAERKSEEKQL